MNQTIRPTIVIHCANPKSPLSNGQKSLAGHMWITLTDSNGKKKSIGFGPESSGIADKGKILTDDDYTYIHPELNSSPITISTELS